MTTSEPTSDDHDRLIVAVERDIAEWEAAIGPGGEKEWKAGQLARRAGSLLAALRTERSARQAAETKAEIAELAYQHIVEQYGPERDVARRMTEQRDALQRHIDAALDVAFNPDRPAGYMQRVRNALAAPAESKEPEEERDAGYLIGLASASHKLAAAEERERNAV